MPKTNKLTIKQRKFVKEYVNNSGNATEAALAAYDTKNRVAARELGYLNLKKPAIQNELETALRKQGLDSDYIASKLNKIVENNYNEKGSVADSLRALETMIKIYDYYPTQKRANLNVNVEPYNNLSFSELKDELAKTRTATEKLLKDLQ